MGRLTKRKDYNCACWNGNQDYTTYENLANAIVLQAVKDYRSAKAMQRTDPKDYSARGRIGVIRKFFRSDWFRTLTDIDGEYLIRMLDEEAKHGDKLVHEGDTA